MDERKEGLKRGLRQLNKDELIRVIEYPGEMCLDTYNYADGKFCPLAIGVGLDNMHEPTHDKVFTELTMMGFQIYNTRGIPGDFYREHRRRDLLIAAREVLQEME